MMPSKDEIAANEILPNECHFRITGMDCAEEIALLKREVGRLVAEEDLGFNLMQGTMSVARLPAGIEPSAIIDAVRRAGLTARLIETEQSLQGDDESAKERHRRLLYTLLSAVSTLTAIVLQQVSLRGWTVSGKQLIPLASKCFFALASAAGVWLVLPKALAAARRIRPDMNLLMIVAVLGAMGIGEWFEGAAVAFLFSLSLLLESWSVQRARRAVAALLDLSPPQARLLAEDGSSTDIRPENVPMGATLLVQPGERIPLDGKVKWGTTEVNQAPITGESQPVRKSVGSDVFAGTINGDGAIQIVSTKRSSDTTLAKIIRLVGQAQAKRGPSEQWVEKFASYYTPIVMILALIVIAVPTLLFQGNLSDWFYRGLVLLVIACPCALVISTPVTIVAGMTAAAREGVLIKGGAFLEMPAKLRAIAFDKTGTLTVGRPRVVEVIPLAGHSERELMERAAGLERYSEHPIAIAILEFARASGIPPKEAEDFRVIQGKGATAKIDGREFWLGSHRYFEERGGETEEVHARLESMSKLGRSVVVIGNEAHVCGLIGISDQVRPGCREILNDLRHTGIDHLIMLSGDNRPTAESIAKELGIDEVRGELLPEDKVLAVENLVGKYGRVAMVGDGVNDAPALARASLGIAMGGTGTDAAIETADIALMGDDLSRLPWLIRHSRRALGIIRQNILFSLSVKGLFVVLTALGMSSLWGAIAADTGASLLVILNGMRLLRPPQ